MCSTAVIISSHVIAVPRNLQFSRLSGVSFFFDSPCFLLISDLAKRVLVLVGFVDERPQDIVELFRVLRSVPVADVSCIC